MGEVRLRLGVPSRIHENAPVRGRRPFNITEDAAGAGDIQNREWLDVLCKNSR